MDDIEDIQKAAYKEGSLDVISDFQEVWGLRILMNIGYWNGCAGTRCLDCPLHHSTDRTSVVLCEMLKELRS